MLLHGKEICFLSVVATEFFVFRFPYFLLCSYFAFVATGPPEPQL